MKQMSAFFICCLCFICLTQAQIIQRQLPPKKTGVQPASTSVYSLTSARVNIQTGNDNKESPSKFFFYIMENKGIWGDGKELFTQQDQAASTNELKVNGTADVPLQKTQSTSPDVFTLPNIENKGLRFVIYYFPNFILDAWRITAVTITLEFKDQYGRLHPVSPYRTVQFNIPNGLLTKSNWVMTGTTDGFLTPLQVTVTDK
jgi:hypothetical protein